MEHYYSKESQSHSSLRQVHYTIKDQAFVLTSDNGVFSKDHLDTGTKILLETLLQHQSPCDKILDLGCGIGPVSQVLHHFWQCHCTLVDTNQRALNLAQQNIPNQIFLNQDGIQSGHYDLCVINPPIRAGKKVVYQLLEQGLACSNALWFVMRKNHGAKSAINHLTALNFELSVINKDKGFWVILAKPRLHQQSPSRS